MPIPKPNLNLKTIIIFIIIVIGFYFLWFYVYDDGNGPGLYHGIPVTTVKGDSYDMGVSLGNNLRPYIKSIIKDYLYKIFPDPKDRDKAYEKAKALEKYIPSDYRIEMDAISQNAKVTYEDILLLNTFIDFTKDELLSCSFSIGKGMSNEGYVYVGHNTEIKHHDILQEYTRLVVYKPSGKKKFVSITFPGFIGVLSGMNEDGLCLNIQKIKNDNYNLKNVPSSILTRMILERQVDVPFVSNYVSDKYVAASINLAIAGKSDNDQYELIVAELSGNKAKILHPDKEGRLITTNIYNSEVDASPFNDNDYLKIFNRINPFTSPINIEKMQKILDSVAKDDMTIQTIIFVPELKKFYLACDKIPSTKGNMNLIDLDYIFKNY